MPRSAPILPSSSAWTACLVTAIGSPVAIVAARTFDISPMTMAGAALPAAVGMLLVILGATAAYLIRHEWVIGAAAGLFASWCSFAVSAHLVGTPFGYGSMNGDAGRLSALATHFATTWMPTDAADPSRPAEYPPLYPMILGRVADLTGKQAWTLLGTGQAVLAAVTILGTFLAWRRLVPPAVALALAGTVFVGIREPSKATRPSCSACSCPSSSAPSALRTSAAGSTPWWPGCSSAS